jgi:hypothetical protein
MQHQHYQLSYFEKLIHVDLKQATSKQKEPDSTFFTLSVSDIISNKNSMLQSFNQYLCDLGKRKQVDWYISMHQHQLVLLMEEMATCLPEADLICQQVSLTEATWLNLYKIIYCNLSELLLFLERKFERYLDIDCRLPFSYLITAKTTLFQDINLLRERFEVTAVDKHLLSIVFQPFTDFIKADRSDFSISYRQLYFLKEMRKQLFELLDGRAEDLTERLKKVLHYLNFNSVQYFDYWTEAINAEIENLPTIREKLGQAYLSSKEGEPGYR